MNEIRYIDLYFLSNFAADALCLYLVCRVLPRAPKLWRLCAAGAFGALFSCLTDLLSPPFWITLPAFLLLLPLSLLIALGKVDRKTFLRAFLFYPLSLSLLGGALYAVSALIGQGLSDPDFSFFPFLAMALMALVFLLLYFLSLARACSARICSVSVTLFGKTHTCACLCDSANLLRDPATGLSVILVSAPFARSALPPSILSAIAFPGQTGSPLTLYPVAFQGAAGKGVLYGFRAENLRLCRGFQKIPLPDALLAPDLSITDFAGCEMLLPAGYPEHKHERKRAC